MNGIKLKIEYNIKFGELYRITKTTEKKELKTKLTRMTKCKMCTNVKHIVEMILRVLVAGAAHCKLNNAHHWDDGS